MYYNFFSLTGNVATICMRNRVKFRVNKKNLLYCENVWNQVGKKVYCAESYATHYNIVDYTRATVIAPSTGITLLIPLGDGCALHPGRRPTVKPTKTSPKSIYWKNLITIEYQGVYILTYIIQSGLPWHT